MTENMIKIEFEVTEPVAKQIAAAAQLEGNDLHGFVEASVLMRLQALDRILHDEADIEVPEDFNAEAWRERYQHIKRLEYYEPDGN